MNERELQKIAQELEDDDGTDAKAQQAAKARKARNKVHSRLAQEKKKKGQASAAADDDMDDGDFGAFAKKKK